MGVSSYLIMHLHLQLLYTTTIYSYIYIHLGPKLYLLILNSLTPIPLKKMVRNQHHTHDYV